MTAATVSPLPADKQKLAAKLIEGLDASALHWLSGYVAGVAAERQNGSKSSIAEASVADIVDVQQRLTVLYGSQTGNAKRLAEELGRRATGAGLAVRVVRADAYTLRDLKQERLLYVVISTQGEGEPPDDARALIELIDSPRAPKLGALQFAVLGLGDSSYPLFCAIGRHLDERLSELGGKRLLTAGEADVDLETVTTPWLDEALKQARAVLGAATAKSTVTPLRPLRATPTWSRERPFNAKVLLNQRITGRDSDRDIRHLELSLEDSGLRYAPGDSLGVWPTQSTALVDAMVDTLQLDADAPVTVAGDQRPLRQWLTERRELTQLTRPFLAAHAERADSAELRALLQPASRDAFTAYTKQAQVLDVLHRYRTTWTAEALVNALRPLTPRLYSIASSQALVGDEVHITVAHVNYRRDGEARWGTTSRYLADRDTSQSVPVFIEANERFHLPDDDDRDIIMIGPGTGVAPFRAFVQERTERGASGRNWLLFGNPHFHADFLYQVEWQKALKSGRLHRLDLAFSRDQPNKIYVQHRLREQGRRLYEWLDGGAHVYVCGDASAMARDVHAALIDVVVEHSGRSTPDAEAWLNELIQQGRYARDVY